jgi:hypothetical protein
MMCQTNKMAKRLDIIKITIREAIIKENNIRVEHRC